MGLIFVKDLVIKEQEAEETRLIVGLRQVSRSKGDKALDGSWEEPFLPTCLAASRFSQLKARLWDLNAKIPGDTGEKSTLMLEKSP